MPQPNSDQHIVSPPSVPGQPYDAAGDAHSATAPFVMLSESGPCDPATGVAHGDWPDSPPFLQT